jgi:cytochrome c oxidase subunit 4
MTTSTHASSARPINYVAIWGILLGALSVSLVLAYLKHAALASALIFAIAIVKALLVASYYMHLKFEPRFVIIAILAGLATLSILFAGLFYDIARVYGG